MSTHKVVLTILDALGQEYTDKIPATRAVKKLERAWSKAKASALVAVEWDKKQLAVLEELKLEIPEGKPAKGKKPKKKGKEADGDEKPAKGKKAKKKRVAKREGNIPLMKRLLAEGKSEKEINKHFLDLYKAQGKEDKDWILSRVQIYKSLATGEKRPRKKKEKDVKKKPKGKPDKKSSKKASKDEAPAKKGKAAKPAKKKGKAKDEEE